MNKNLPELALKKLQDWHVVTGHLYITYPLYVICAVYMD